MSVDGVQTVFEGFVKERPEKKQPNARRQFKLLLELAYSDCDRRMQLNNRILERGGSKKVAPFWQRMASTCFQAIEHAKRTPDFRKHFMEALVAAKSALCNFGFMTDDEDLTGSHYDEKSKGEADGNHKSETDGKRKGEPDGNSIMLDAADDSGMGAAAAVEDGMNAANENGMPQLIEALRSNCSKGMEKGWRSIEMGLQLDPRGENRKKREQLYLADLEILKKWITTHDSNYMSRQKGGRNFAWSMAYLNFSWGVGKSFDRSVLNKKKNNERLKARRHNQKAMAASKEEGGTDNSRARDTERKGEPDDFQDAAAGIEEIVDNDDGMDAEAGIEEIMEDNDGMDAEAGIEEIVDNNDGMDAEAGKAAGKVAGKSGPSRILHDMKWETHFKNLKSFKVVNGHLQPRRQGKRVSRDEIFRVCQVHASNSVSRPQFMGRSCFL